MMNSASLMVILANKKARKCIAIKYQGGASLSKEAVEDLGREVDTVTGGDSFSASSQEESEK